MKRQKIFSSLSSILTTIAFLLFPAVSAEAQFPGVPLNVAASDGTSTTSVSVSWQAPSSGAAVSFYKVFRSETNQFCPGAAIGTTSGTNYLDSSVLPTKIYYYSVKAVAGTGHE